jgi:thiol-disulfide isomerase/thioredoxin
MSRWQAAAWVTMLAVGAALVLMLLSPSPAPEPTLAEAPVPPAIMMNSSADETGEVAPLVNDGEGALGPGMVAPLDYSLKDMDGFDVSLASFKGKVILINFWATWCGPCKAEIPDLVQLQAQYPDDLVVLGVSVDDTASQMRPYADQYGMNYPVLVANGRDDFKDAYGPLWGIPVSVIIDRDGFIRIRHAGLGTYEQFEQEIQKLL